MHFQNSKLSFFHKQCVIWSFPPSFNEFHQNFYIFKISGTYNSGAIDNEEKSYNQRYLPVSFSKYNETSPISFNSKEAIGTMMHAKF